MPDQALPAMPLVLSHTFDRPPPATNLPALMARASGVNGMYFSTKLMPFLRPLPIAPTTPVLALLTHSRPAWTFSPITAALCFAQSIAPPAFCFAQSNAEPAFCETQLAPLFR